MKTTVDIPTEVLNEAIIRRKRMSELVRYSGTSGTLLTNDEIEALERRRARGFGRHLELGASDSRSGAREVRARVEALLSARLRSSRSPMTSGLSPAISRIAPVAQGQAPAPASR